MDAIKSALEPITNLLPEGAREIGVWVVLVVLILLIVGLLSVVSRALFGRKPKADKGWEKDVIELESCPLPPPAMGRGRLTVFNVPARLRLVVVAPVGRDHQITEAMATRLLDHVVPGLWAVAETDRPLIRIWPPQLSHEGFSNTFHRCTAKPEPENAPSRWVLLAGRAMVGKQPVLLGLGAWADQPNVIGRKILDPEDWLGRIRPNVIEP
jgi:hypothetical protein